MLWLMSPYAANHPVPALGKQTLAAQVMEYVRTAAQDGEMRPGEWYSVYQLSEELNISRSPVREGLLRLEEAGLVKFSRNRGFQIVETEPSDVADIFDLRLCIEPPIAGRAAARATKDDVEELRQILDQMTIAADHDDEATFFAWDQQLHDVILSLGGSKRGRTILEQLRTHTQILSDSTVRSQRSLQQIQAEHQPIVDAITDNSPEAAMQAMETHITATGIILLQQTIRRYDPDLSDEAVKAKATEIWDSIRR